MLICDTPVRMDATELAPGPAEEWLASVLSPHTQRAYRTDVEDFFGKPVELLAEEDLRMVTTQRVIAWLDRLRAVLAPATVARKLAALRALFRFAQALGVVDRNPARPELVHVPKVADESTTRGLTAEEARRLLDAITGDDLAALRDRALLELALRTGLRRAELVAADRTDLGTERGYTVLTVTSKGGKRQSVKVPPPAAHALDVYLAARTDDSPALFVSHARNGTAGRRLSAQGIYDRVTHYACRAGLYDVTPHSLRHTFVTLALDGGASLRQVQAAARHVDPRTTARYDRRRNFLDDNAVDYVHF